ncbi:MAG: hypothetical protein R2827_13260 [Bdellovibrionales bacterium]
MNLEDQLKNCKNSSYQMMALTDQDKNTALQTFANLILENKDFLLIENKKDLNEQAGKISPSLYQRLVLDEGKNKSTRPGD